MPTPYDVLRDKLRDPLLALELWDIMKDQPEKQDFIEQYNKAGIEYKYHFVRCVDMCAMARCKLIGTTYKMTMPNTIMAHFVAYMTLVSSPDSQPSKKKQNQVPQAVSYSWINQAIDSVISRITNVPVDDDVVMTLKSDHHHHHSTKSGKSEKSEKSEKHQKRTPAPRSERSERSESRADRSESARDDVSIVASSSASSNSSRRRQPEVDPKRDKTRKKSSARSNRDDDEDEERSKTFYMDDDDER